MEPLRVQFTLVSILFASGLFAGMIGLLELGRRLGRRRQGRDQESSRAGLGAVEGAVFALMGLVIAFTFSGAAARFDTRRQLIVEEANAIGTAWLRVDLLPPTAQPELRDLFRRYLDQRLAVYQKRAGMSVAREDMEKANALQGEIWGRVVAVCQQAPSPVVAQIIPALNQMFDIASTRTAAIQMHPPAMVFAMLGVLTLMSALLAGYAMAGGRTRSWIHLIGFAVIVAGTVYVIVDFEFPRMGIIRVDAVDYIAAFGPDKLNGSESKSVALKFPGRTMEFTGQAFILEFILPNLYFHTAMTYALLRHNGVEVGKQDFLARG